jgi:UDP-N-acetyl-2-amino-2-deoxyglucuronate dehydrogenase
VNEKRAIRMALFGPGGFGYLRSQAMASSPLVDYAACYSPFEAERLACEEEFGARAVARESAIWDDPTIKGVVLATPNQLHLQQVRAAASSGKHIFVEKPLAPTVAESREILELCTAAGVILMVGHNARRRTRIRTMKRFLDDGRLGQALVAEANNSHAGGLSIQPDDWRWSPLNCPGGPLTQLGIHHVDTLQYLLGPVARVSAWQRRLAVKAAIPDVSTTLLEFESGALGYLGAHYAVPDTRYLFLLGTEANVRWDRALGLVVESEAGSESITLQEIDTIQEEIDEFALCIATNSRPEVGGVEALAAVTVIEAAVLSNERGRPVDIAELLG